MNNSDAWIRKNYDIYHIVIVSLYFHILEGWYTEYINTITFLQDEPQSTHSCLLYTREIMNSFSRDHDPHIQQLPTNQMRTNWDGDSPHSGENAMAAAILDTHLLKKSNSNQLLNRNLVSPPQIIK